MTPRAQALALSDEQKALVEHQGSAVVDACAGAGKTATLVAYARARPGARILYLAYNRSVRIEAQRRFRQAGCPHVAVHTVHSLAYRGTRAYEHELLPSGTYTPADVLELLALPRYADERELLLASHVARLLHRFLNGTERSPTEIDYPAHLLERSARRFAQQHLGTIYELAERLWELIRERRAPWSHDAYLKIYYLQTPRLDYDIILLDEAQDSNPVTLGLLARQSADVIAVGDSQQAIYGFRYAQNALQSLPYPRLGLRRSWRFGPSIAALASQAVALKSALGTYPQGFRIEGCGPTKPPRPQRGAAPRRPERVGEGVAVLARSNIRLLGAALSSITNGARRLFFEGGLNTYTFVQGGASLYDIWHLYCGQPQKIRSAFLRRFRSFKHLAEYLANTADAELQLLYDIVRTYRARLPAALRDLRARETQDKHHADLVFATLHKAKGMEYPEVLLLEDFISAPEIEKSLEEQAGMLTPPARAALNEEINMLYTAITRAAHRVLFARHPFDAEPMPGGAPC